MDRASLQQLLGRGLSLAEIGKRFGRHESTVAYWVQKYGLEAVNRDAHAARGGLPREELERLIGAGMTIAELAETVGRSRGRCATGCCGTGSRRMAVRAGVPPRRARPPCKPVLPP